jgi:hypothetical protein
MSWLRCRRIRACLQGWSGAPGEVTELVAPSSVDAVLDAVRPDKTPVDRYHGAPSLQAQAFAALRETIPAIGAAVPAEALAEARRSADPDAVSKLHQQLQQLGREHRAELEGILASHRDFRLLLAAPVLFDTVAVYPRRRRIHCSTSSRFPRLTTTDSPTG